MPKPRKTLVDVFEHSVAHFADRPLFGTKTGGQYRWMTYREFGEQVDQLRGALAQLGVGPDDTVAVISDNRVEWAVGAYATYTQGARYCPMYEAQSLENWRYILEDSGAIVVLVADEAIDAKVRPLLGELDTLEQVIYFDGPRGVYSYASMLGLGLDHPAPIVRPDEDDVCALIYTSGTTGAPKGVELSHRNVMANLESIYRFEIVGPDDVSVSFLPWAHAFGHTVELHLLFSVGAAMGLAESVHTLAENMLEVRPTVLLAVPRVFNRIYEGVNRKLEEEGGLKARLFAAAMHNAERFREQLDDGDPGLVTRTLEGVFDNLVFRKVRDRFGGRLKFAISGAAALNPTVARFIDYVGITVIEGYGLTETAPLVSANLPWARKMGSAGRPVPGVEVTIRRSEDHPPGVGEVCVRGPNVMLGYHGLPHKTAEVLDPDGTFHTGDLGRIDEDGFLWLTGRLKEEFKLENGKFVSPATLEESLQLSRYIDQVLLEGPDRPHVVALVNVNGHELRAWARDNGLDPKADDLLRHPRVRELFQKELDTHSDAFAGYSRPRDFVLVEDEWSVENGLMTPSLKMRRPQLVERYREQLDGMYGKPERLGGASPAPPA